MSHLASFSINADDVARARNFYESVFGWTFEKMGPPDFYLINSAQMGEAHGMHTLHPRRELKQGVRSTGYECIISVPSLSDVVAAIRTQKGNITMEETVIIGHGRLAFFEDTEGNLAGAMQYDKAAR